MEEDKLLSKRNNCVSLDQKARFFGTHINISHSAALILFVFSTKLMDVQKGGKRDGFNLVF